MSKCASIVFYLSILTLEHTLFRSEIAYRTRIEFVFRKRVKNFIRTEAVSFIQGSLLSRQSEEFRIDWKQGNV
jgi:hypothetical protein